MSDQVITVRCAIFFGPYRNRRVSMVKMARVLFDMHHLKAISALEEGVAVHCDIAADFAVSCSNCHRVIHRSVDPSNLAALRTVIESNNS
jgi:predicted HNH restriction endonuclease